jgi:hypothetical protein
LPIGNSAVSNAMIQAPINLEDRALLEPNGQRSLLLLDKITSLLVGR